MTAIAPTTVSRQFRERREPEWHHLESLLDTAERRSVRALTDQDLLALPILYRGALSSLSVARETSLDLELITYLEQLCARAYFFVYGVRSRPGSKVGRFLVQSWPAAVQAIWRESLLALLLMVIGAVAGYLLVTNDPNWYGSLIPGDTAQGRNFESTAGELRHILYHSDAGDALTFFATSLFTHNAGVCLLSFALGFAFGIPTAMLLVFNVTLLGAMLALYDSHGLMFELGGWLFIHGTTELYAILLAGAAGFHIGWAMIFPGEDSRLVAATRAGRTAGVVMVGVVLMLLAAAILEGYGRQLVSDDLTRYAVGGTMLALWLLYFYLPRPRTASHG